MVSVSVCTHRHRHRFRHRHRHRHRRTARCSDTYRSATGGEEGEEEEEEDCIAKCLAYLIDAESLAYLIEYIRYI